VDTFAADPAKEKLRLKARNNLVFFNLFRFLPKKKGPKEKRYLFSPSPLKERLIS